jgi:uncharacterized protein YutE (UPF0331/DUF86 family)
MIIHPFFTEINGILQGLGVYQASMENELKKMENNEVRIFNKLYSRNDRDSLTYRLERQGVDWRYKYFLPRTFRYSFIVYLCTVVQNRINSLYDLVKEIYPPLDIDPKESIKTRLKIYLYQSCEFPHEKWIVIENLYKLRNCIAHTYGNVEKSDDRNRLKVLAKEGKGLSISTDFDDNFLFFNRKYCLNILLDVNEFFYQISIYSNSLTPKNSPPLD